MKHIFKKLHHQPNRSNETPQPPPPQSPTSSSSSSDSRATTSSSSNAPTTAAGALGSSASHDSSGDTNRPQQDYYSSEEEYQVQLALALSASSSGQVSAFREKALIRNVVAADNAITAAEILSRRYWVSSICLFFSLYENISFYMFWSSIIVYEIFLQFVLFLF